MNAYQKVIQELQEIKNKEIYQKEQKLYPFEHRPTVDKLADGFAIMYANETGELR